MKGFGMNPPAETSIPHRLLMLCNEVERLDRACWQLAKERDDARGRSPLTPNEVTEVIDATRRNAGIAILEIAGQFPSDTIGDRCVDLLHPLIESLIPANDPAWESAGRAGKVQE